MESNAPQLLTMPLRFRVWDTVSNHFITHLNGVKELSINDIMHLFPSVIDLERFIISQDTGLKDKDGRSIYTGDIVQLTKTKYDKIDRINHIEEFTLPVVYEHGRVALKVDRLDEYGGAYWVLLSMQRPRDLQALGDIWQNPELLEGECCE